MLRQHDEYLVFPTMTFGDGQNLLAAEVYLIGAVHIFGIDGNLRAGANENGHQVLGAGV